MKILFRVKNQLAEPLFSHPVSHGIAIPCSLFFDPSKISLKRNEIILPLQTEVLERWPDGSLKWILLDFQTDLNANEEKEFSLEEDIGVALNRHYEERINTFFNENNQVTVNTGAATFEFDLNTSLFFKEVSLPQKGVYLFGDIGWKLINSYGKNFIFKKEKVSWETKGALRSSLLVEGEAGGLQLKIRYHFFAGRADCKITPTLLNPKRAKHRGGIWDLGDAGSFLIQEFSLDLSLDSLKEKNIYLAEKKEEKLSSIGSSSVVLFQESSGGAHWNSHNHANREEKVLLRHKGYWVKTQKEKEAEDRAEPILIVSDHEKSIGVALTHFWQNFPKAFEVNSHHLSIGFFPKFCLDCVELQGGEQKTEELFLNFSFESPLKIQHQLLSFLSPPKFLLDPKYLLSTGVLGAILPLEEEKNGFYQNWLNRMIEGEFSFIKKREQIDEYGWRHFGCLVADHEAVGSREEETLVSHYNNQYDPLKGFIEQYLRSGDSRWWSLAEDLAKHTIDIDLYHTQEDKAAYSGGYFWHTDHYRDAGLSTHRTYTAHPFVGDKHQAVGGGPSNEHNYTTGLLYYYFLTGNKQAKEMVLQLADWVLQMEDGKRTVFRFLDRGDTGLSSQTKEAHYHGPGRGGANSINTLLDGFILTHNPKYLKQLEKLIRRCIHPNDRIEEKELNDPERRWSYLVFLQVLCRYLDWKEERQDLDAIFFYAHASLTQYLLWMVKHEVPYTEMKEKVLIWTETWPAQDMRKADVLAHAAKYVSGDLRKKCLERSLFFFQKSLSDLALFQTCFLTRPLVILMVSGAAVEGLLKKSEARELPKSQIQDWGKPKRFVPQKQRAKIKAVILLFLLTGFFLFWRFL